MDGAAPDPSSASHISSIDKFLAVVNEKGLQDSSRYSIVLTGPGPVGTLESDNAIYCKGLNVKGVSFQTTNRFSHGPERDIPFLEVYGDGTSLTFYNDYNFTEYNYFLKWMQYIGDNKKEQPAWYIGWYNDFIGEMLIVSYDETNRSRFGVSLNEVYPKSLSDITMAYDFKGREISTFTVNLAFHHYEIKVYS